MASALDVIGDWISGEDGREKLFRSNKELVVRWLNRAQIRHTELSGVLRDVWTPIVTEGEVELPEDFLTEYPDRVKWTSTIFLSKIDYPTAKLLTYTSTCHYSIYGGKFYVFKAADGEPEIPYKRKPEELTPSGIKGEDLEIPTEHHDALVVFMDAMYERTRGNIGDSLKLLSVFKGMAEEDGLDYALRTDLPLITNG